MAETVADAVGVHGDPMTGGLLLSGVSKSFPGVKALQDVSLHARPGEIHGLVGENGAGKSTLMAIASGALQADEGEVVLCGDPLSSASPELARSLGLAIVRQEPALMPDLSVAENLYLGMAKAVRPSPWRMNEWATGLLRAWDDDVLIDARARVDTLRPEERFIVEIAKAMAQHPSILVLDEPTEHLATEDVERLFGRLRTLRDAGQAIVYISHRVREVKMIADEITVLRDGRTKGTFPASELSESDIVNLIVGRSLDVTFPAKGDPTFAARETLRIEGLTGPGFHDVTITARQGEVIGLAGIDGNGQREFLRALAGLSTSRGEVAILGHPTRLRSAAGAKRAGIALVPGDRHREGILAQLSVRENFALRSIDTLSRAGFVVPRREDEATDRAIARYRIKTPDRETPIDSLSGGNQQKTVIASVLATEPKILLADQPTQGVDIGTKVEIYALLRAAADRGVTVFVLSADSLELSGLCDRVVVFSRGEAVRTLEGDEVSEREITSAVLTATTVRARSHETSRLVRWFAGSTAPLATVATAVLLLGVVASLISSFYLTDRAISGVLALSAILALVACGQQMVMAVGGIDLSVGPLMGSLVVVQSFFLYDNASSLTQLSGWLFFFGLAIVVGLTNWVLTEILEINAMIATLATYMALQALSLTLRPAPGGLISFGFIDGVTQTIGFLPLAFVAAAVIAIVLELLLRRSRPGIVLRGVGSRPEAARVAGLPPRLVRLCAYVGCSLLAALAAIPFIAQIGTGDPSVGLSFTLQSIAAAVVGGASLFGGRASFLGALLGALLISQVGAVTTYLHLNDAWNSFVLGAMTILAVAAYSRARRLAVPR